MSATEPTLVPPNPRRTILWLVVGHIVVGLIGAFVAYPAGNSPSLRGAAFLGIVFSQTSLLGIWGGLGSNPWWHRVIGVVEGVGYLALLLGVGISDLSLLTFLVVVLATAFVATPLLVVRFFKVAVQLVPAPVAAVGGIQFSIRHLMILTFAVACLITIGKWVQSYFTDGECWGLMLATCFKDQTRPCTTIRRFSLAGEPYPSSTLAWPNPRDAAACCGGWHRCLSGRLPPC